MLEFVISETLNGKKLKIAVKITPHVEPNLRHYHSLDSFSSQFFFDPPKIVWIGIAKP